MPASRDPAPPRPAARPLPRLARWLLLAFAVLCLVLAVIGVVLPGMPATVFILLAAWAAARSSPRLHAWLLAHRLFGPMLHDWENGHCVSRRAKWSASAAMAFGAVVLAWTAYRPWIAIAGIGCMAVVLTWLWRRPEAPL
ncbi:YbaN family protein [Variovorax sp. ZT4R33]|uniref:YbaN family protein n=1 Tax=Variovorax sp. ZT4R33 TaxID=3443743 RepID=UPI003F48C34C